MEPIVSPWFIYFLGMVDSIKECFAGIAITAVVVLVSVGFAWLISDGDFEDKTYVKMKKWAKRLIACLCVFLLLGIITPSKNTVIAMYVADNITPNNVEKALEVGVDFKNEIKKDIIELIEGIQKEEKKSITK